jgi:putative endonuclease
VRATPGPPVVDPWSCAGLGDFARIDEAFAFEKMVQGWSRKKRIALIEGRWDDLPALASRAWRHRDAT